MLEIAAQIIVYLLIAALIGAGIGYLICKLNSEKKNSTSNTEVLASEEVVTEVIVEKETASEEKSVETLLAPLNGSKDELTKIKGLGPKMEEKLNAVGIYHFSQIATWTESSFEWLEVNTTLAPRAKKENWVAQAKLFI